MTGREHMGIGVGATFAVVTAAQMSGHSIDTATAALALAAAAAGSLGPDLDHPNSLAGASIPAALIVYSGLFLLSPWVASLHPALAGLDLSTLGSPWTAAAWTALVVGLFLFALSWILAATFGHRGPVHSVGFGLAATAMVIILSAVFSAPLWLAIPFAWGWIAHLLADATTPRGLHHAFWPFVRETR